MILIHFLFFWLSIAANTFGQITAAPSCPIQADPWHSQVGLLVQKRGISTFCDSNRKFYCFQPAACVSGSDGFIGCCTAVGTTCVPRTKCIDYTSGITASCDYVTGGCVYCSQPNLPFCVKAYSNNNYIFQCGTEKLTTTYADTDTGIITATPSAVPTPDARPTETDALETPSTSSSSSTMSFLSSSSSPSSLTALPSSSTATNTSAPEPTPSGHVASSRALIIGVIVGAAAGSILLLVLLFIIWKLWKRRRSDVGGVSKEKSNNTGYSLGSEEESSREHTNSQDEVVCGSPNPPGPAELEEPSHRSTDGTSLSTHARDAANGHPYSPEDIRGAAEAPSNAPPWSSPSTTMTSPTPSNSSLWMMTPGMGTPRAPSHYVAYTPYTPSSAYSASGQPPSSLPQSRYRDANTAQDTVLAELEAHEVGRAQ